MSRSYLFLYTELAGYTIACLKALKLAEPAASVTVVHYPVNKEAPFAFDFSAIGNFKQITDFPSYKSLESFVHQVKPTHINCSGWINKKYVRICYEWRKKAVNVLCFDNHLVGNLKQWIWKFTGAFFLRNTFNYVWVPGSRQVQYARFLGFKEHQILKHFYSCNTPVFLEKGKTALASKTTNFPKVLLCVARYIPVKAYEELWGAFVEWQTQEPSEWQLWCVGTGEGYEKRILHPKIKHYGFLQPDQLEPVINAAGVFVLISKFEPWGVAVHEFAAAGFPLLLSPQVGSADSFFDNKNGWMIASHQRADIIAALRQIAATPNASLLAKATRSQELAASISPQTWAQTLGAI